MTTKLKNPQGANSFFESTNRYLIGIPLSVSTITPGANSQELQPIEITPGNYFRGVEIQVTSSGGVLGSTDSLVGDAPFSALQSLSFETVDGSQILYPKGGYAEYIIQKWCQPWCGDPAKDAGDNGSSGAGLFPGFSNSINPAWRQKYMIENRFSVAVLPNTDARAQYRLNLTVAAFVGGLVSTGTGSTAPAITITVTGLYYAQPPATDAHGTPNTIVPPGIAFQRKTRHELPGISSGDYVFTSKLTGNLIRNDIFVVRNSSGVRTDLTGDPIIITLSNQALGKPSRSAVLYDMITSAAAGGLGSLNNVVRDTGVYVFPHWHNPGDLMGDPWLKTLESDYYTYEFSGAPSGGSIEHITEEIIPVGNAPASLFDI